jgi:hypothetical protein
MEELEDNPLWDRATEIAHKHTVCSADAWDQEHDKECEALRDEIYFAFLDVFNDTRDEIKRQIEKILPTAGSPDQDFEPLEGIGTS